MRVLKHPNHNKRLKLTFNSHGSDFCTKSVCSVIALYKRELKGHRKKEAALVESTLRDAKLLHQKDEQLRQADMLNKEAEHRLMNGLQLVKSVLAMQSRSAENPEAASTLREAVERVSMLVRVHQLLHSIEAVEEINFREYLVQLSNDLSDMVSTEAGNRSVCVVGAEIRLPRATATPLSFIASELITNSMKHAKGKIVVALQRLPNGKAVLSVSDDGPGLPTTFDPAKAKGLGMKIIAAFVRQIDGELTYGAVDQSIGTCFSLTFRVDA